MNENRMDLATADFINLVQKQVRFDVICDIMNSDILDYQQIEAIRIVCGIEKNK